MHGMTRGASYHLQTILHGRSVYQVFAQRDSLGVHGFIIRDGEYYRTIPTCTDNVRLLEYADKTIKENT